jgi:hypothetical protein
MTNPASTVNTQKFLSIRFDMASLADLLQEHLDPIFADPSAPDLHALRLTNRSLVPKRVFSSPNPSRALPCLAPIEPTIDFG